MSKSKRIQSFINRLEETDGEPSNKKTGFGGITPKRLVIGVGATLFSALIIGGAAFAALNSIYDRSGSGPEDLMTFTVERGDSLSKITNNLNDLGFISNPFVFKAVTRLRGNQARFKAGEFYLSHSFGMSEIYTALSSGQSILYPVTVPEGRTSAQVIQAMRDNPAIVNDNPDVPAEGSLLPETYMIPRGTKMSQVIKQMQDAQTRALDRLWDNRQAGLPISTRAEAVILASVVEKETGIGGERAKIAGVFVNRLKRGMRLESDPTIIYGITQGEPLGRGIRRSEINRKTDWNTYQIDGLPKTPICNPGYAALEAVLNPDETDAIFFVADGTGGHVFSRTLREHNRNVTKWRKIERAIRAKAKVQ